MRQNPVGEPAATAALNFGTPRRRSSLKRLGPFCHCRQRDERNLRRIHASRFVSTRGVWKKPKYLVNSAVPRAECGGAQALVASGSLWTAQAVHLLYREQSFRDGLKGQAPNPWTPTVQGW